LRIITSNDRGNSYLRESMSALRLGPSDSCLAATRRATTVHQSCPRDDPGATPRCTSLMADGTFPGKN